MSLSEFKFFSCWTCMESVNRQKKRKRDGGLQVFTETSNTVDPSKEKPKQKPNALNSRTSKKPIRRLNEAVKPPTTAATPLTPTKLFSEKFTNYRDHPAELNDFWMSPSKVMMKSIFNPQVTAAAPPSKECPIIARIPSSIIEKTPSPKKLSIHHNHQSTPVSQRKMTLPNAPTHIRSSIMRNRIDDMMDIIKLDTDNENNVSRPYQPTNLLDVFRSPFSKLRKRPRTAL